MVRETKHKPKQPAPISATNSDSDRRRRMPPLSALKAFEAAARHMSFRAAADELNVTHSAVSHQIKSLEEFLDVALFLRGGRAVKLTEEGRLLFPVLRDSFDNIAAGTDLLRRRRVSGSLTLQVYVTLAVKWLLPRLHDFAKRNPEIQIALSTSYTGWDFSREEGDAGIIFARHKHAELHYTHLGRATWFPVCAPGLLKGDPPLEKPVDLLNHRLFQVYPARSAWSDWLGAVGVGPDIPDITGPYFDNYLLALEAAASGEGLSLATRVFVEQDIRDGRLVAPFKKTSETSGGWYFVCSKERRQEPRIARVRDWLCALVAESGKENPFD
ncbi:MAG: transcriptional regulator GcvA [Alphaproteobacteria bacterium]